MLHRRIWSKLILIWFPLIVGLASKISLNIDIRGGVSLIVQPVRSENVTTNTPRMCIPGKAYARKERQGPLEAKREMLASEAEISDDTLSAHHNVNPEGNVDGDDDVAASDDDGDDPEEGKTIDDAVLGDGTRNTALNQ